MVKKADISEFLSLQEQFPVIDVRSPAEFSRGHIPGAANIPLFEDPERAEVGTSYKQEGKQEAILKALGIVGPKMQDMVIRAKEVAPKGNVLVHCWRGGMRSESFAWLLDTSGFGQVTILNGGYKSFRRYVLQELSTPAEMIIVGGFTGSGKTEILHQIGNTSQFIDLEDLANHRGSAFGGIGQDMQPSTEHFENLLCQQWRNIDRSQPIWLEDESQMIGSVKVPDEFIGNMRRSPVIFLNIPREHRARRLVREYAGLPDDELRSSLYKIEKRLGGDNLQKALIALEEGDYLTVAEIALKYYDKSYKKLIASRDPQLVYYHEISEDDPGMTSRKLIKLYQDTIYSHVR